jgi:hypothetical protein
VTYEDLLNRIIADGIAEVRVAYDDPKEHHKRDGAIEGFEACSGKTPNDLVALWTEAERRAAQLMRNTTSLPPLDHVLGGGLMVPAVVGLPRDRQETSSSEAQDYVRQRYKALQIEFVLNVLSIALEKPLLAHLPTARGSMKYAAMVAAYAAIVNVRDEGVSA